MTASPASAATTSIWPEDLMEVNPLTCTACRGSQNIFSYSRQHGAQWWPCPCCHGAGATTMFGPPTLRSHAR